MQSLLRSQTAGRPNAGEYETAVHRALDANEGPESGSCSDLFSHSPNEKETHPARVSTWRDLMAWRSHGSVRAQCFRRTSLAQLYGVDWVIARDWCYGSEGGQSRKLLLIHPNASLAMKELGEEGVLREMAQRAKAKAKDSLQKRKALLNRIERVQRLRSLTDGLRHAVHIRNTERVASLKQSSPDMGVNVSVGPSPMPTPPLSPSSHITWLLSPKQPTPRFSPSSHVTWLPSPPRASAPPPSPPLSPAPSSPWSLEGLRNRLGR